MKYLSGKVGVPFATKENSRGETPINVVSGQWNETLADFYVSIGTAIGIDLDRQRIQNERPRIAAIPQGKDQGKSE